VITKYQEEEVKQAEANKEDNNIKEHQEASDMAETETQLEAAAVLDGTAAAVADMDTAQQTQVVELEDQAT